MAKRQTLLSRVEQTLAGLMPTDPAKDLIESILEDHQDLKKLIKILKDPDQTNAKKQTAFEQFRSLLLSHSTAEEKAMYSISRHIRGVELKTEEGVVEHRVAKDLVKKIKNYQSASSIKHWKSQLQVLGELVEHHLKEEERDLLPVVKKKLEAHQNEIQARLFLRLRTRSQKNPSKSNSGVLDQKS